MVGVTPVWLVADAASWLVCPNASAKELGWTLSAVIPGTSADTVMVTAWLIVALAKPVPEPVAVTTMVATPGATADTTPAAETVAMAVELVVYVYATVRPAGCTVPTSVTDCPTANCAAEGETANVVIAGEIAAT